MNQREEEALYGEILLECPEPQPGRLCKTRVGQCTGAEKDHFHPTPMTTLNIIFKDVWQRTNQYMNVRDAATETVRDAGYAVP